MSEIRVKSTGKIKLFESDNTSSVTIASPASLSANRTITIPDADVDLTNIATNTAKTSNATHSGEVTGATALTIADNIVDEANLKVSNTPTNGYMLTAQSGNTGGLTWAEAPSGLFTKITSVNGSGSTTENIIDNCFTSTYRNYFVTCEKISISNSSSKCEFRLRTGGGSGAYAGNNMGGASQGWLGGSNSEMTQQKANSGIFPLTNNTYADDDFAFHFYVFNPIATNERTIVSGRAVYREGSTSYVGFNDFGFLSVSTENHTGFAINSSSAQFNAGARITVYGITNPS